MPCGSCPYDSISPCTPTQNALCYENPYRCSKTWETCLENYDCCDLKCQTPELTAYEPTCLRDTDIDWWMWQNRSRPQRGRLEHPFIFVHPVGGTINIYDTLILWVNFTGSMPLNFVWYKDGIPIPNTNNSVYIKHNVLKENDEGHYKCRITNWVGEAESSEAFVEAYLYPVATLQPDGARVQRTGSWLFLTDANGTEPIQCNQDTL